MVSVNGISTPLKSQWLSYGNQTTYPTSVSLSIYAIMISGFCNTIHNAIDWIWKISDCYTDQNVKYSFDENKAIT